MKKIDIPGWKKEQVTMRQEEAVRAAQYDPLREKLNQMLNVKYCVDTVSRERELRNREKQMDQPQH